MELTRGSLVNSIGKLLNNEVNSDVTFVFKNSDIKYFAHKLLLSSRSDVFTTMFYGAVKEVTTSSNEIEIVDIEPETFLELLRFIYTDQINLNDEKWFDIVYASHKYNIEYLDSFCADFLSKSLNINNVCSFLNQCCMYNNELTEECLTLIDWAIDDLIKLKKLDDLSDEALTMVAERDTLIVKETDLFKFMIKRSDNLSETNEPMSKRKKKDSIFEKLRFPTMSVNEFSDCFKLKPEIFTSEQISSIFKFCSSAIRDDHLIYSTTKRGYNKEFNNENINVIEFEGNKISSQTAHKLKFCVNRPMALCGIGFTVQSLSMKLCKLDGLGNSHILCEYKSQNCYFLSKDSHTITITFTSDIILFPNNQYVVETDSGFNSKLICAGVSKRSEFEHLFVFSCIETVVKNMSFKLHSRKRKFEIE